MIYQIVSSLAIGAFAGTTLTLLVMDKYIRLYVEQYLSARGL